MDKGTEQSLGIAAKAWFRQLANHELAERSMMGQGIPFQDLSAWQLVHGQWEHVFREGLQGAHELAPRPPSFGHFLTKKTVMIELNGRRTITNPIRCSGRASDGPNSSAPFAIVLVELTPSPVATAEFTVDYEEPDCVNQSGNKYPDNEEVGYFVSGAARGVKDAAGHYESLGISLRGLQARIVRLVAHEIDSTERAFWTAAKNAMAACLVNVQK